MKTLFPVWLVLVSTAVAVGDDRYLSLADSVVSQRNENRQMLHGGSLSWTARSGKRSGKLHFDKRLRMVFDGQNTAYWRRMELVNDDGSLKVRTHKFVFDGSEGRLVELPAGKVVGVTSRRELQAFDDWLMSIEWTVGATRVEGVQSGRLEKLMLTRADVENTDEATLCHFTFVAPGEGSVVESYDISRGGCFVSRKEMQLDGKMIQDRTHTSFEPMLGFWFTKSVVTRNYSLKTGEVMNESRAELIVDESSFNDLSNAPSDAFDVPITSEVSVNDYRAGSPPISYEGVSEPIPMRTLLGHQRRR